MLGVTGAIGAYGSMYFTAAIGYFTWIFSALKSPLLITEWILIGFYLCCKNKQNGNIFMSLYYFYTL